MDGNTPIDCYQPQFSQREASQLSEVEATTINNWLHRGDYTLAEPDDRRLKGRRFFSIADIAAFHTMDFCIRSLDMRPASAAVAGQIVFKSFGDGTIMGDKDEVSGKRYEFWHIMHKTPFSVGAIDGWPDGWSVQRVWKDRKKEGAFYQYDPISYPEEEPIGLPHFPCLSIPTSELARRIFLKCSDYLLAEAKANEGKEGGSE